MNRQRLSGGEPGGIHRRSFFLIAILIIGIVFSWTVLREIATSTETYRTTIQALDEKKADVLAITAASTATAAAITIIPDDVGTPVAEKLEDITEYLVWALIAIYVEKYLLTLFGFVSTVVLIPFSFILLIWHCVSEDRRKVFLAVKLLVSGALIVVLIPFSTIVTGYIYNTYKESNDETLSIATRIEEAVDENDAAEKTIWDRISDATKSIKSGVSSTLALAKNALNRFIDAIVLLIVNDVVIPILVLASYVILTKWIFKFDIMKLSPSFRKDVHYVTYGKKGKRNNSKSRNSRIEGMNE